MKVKRTEKQLIAPIDLRVQNTELTAQSPFCLILIIFQG